MKPWIRFFTNWQVTWVGFSLSLPFLLQGKPPKIRRAQLIARFIKKDTSSYSCLLYAFCLSVSLNWEIWKIKKTTEPHQQKNRKCNAKTIITMKLHPQNIITKGKKAMTMKKKRISLASFSALFACKSLIATFFCVEFNLFKVDWAMLFHVDVYPFVMLKASSCCRLVLVKVFCFLLNSKGEKRERSYNLL